MKLFISPNQQRQNTEFSCKLPGWLAESPWAEISFSTFLSSLDILKLIYLLSVITVARNSRGVQLCVCCGEGDPRQTDSAAVDVRRVHLRGADQRTWTSTPGLPPSGALSHRCDVTAGTGCHVTLLLMLFVTVTTLKSFLSFVYRLILICRM